MGPSVNLLNSHLIRLKFSSSLFFFLLSTYVFKNVVAIERQQMSDVCNQDILDRSFVTRCGSDYCEPVIERDDANDDNNEWPSSSDIVIQVQSTRKGDRFLLKKLQAFDTTKYYYEESHTNGTIFVNTKTRYQRVLGFGTTLTDSSCINVDDLPENLRSRLIDDYFSTKDGIGLNLIKVPIGSTKYSHANYALDQPDINQVELSPYDIDHRIPLIKDAQKAAGRFKNRIKIIASSLTAPSSYKRNGKLTGGGSLKEDRFGDYASYLDSFVQAYNEKGLDTWALILGENSVSTIQIQQSNETKLEYNSMSMNPSEVTRLIQSILKTREKSTNHVEQFRLLVLGDNRANIPVWANAIFNNREVKDSVAGVAYNCDMDDFAPYDNLEYLIKRFPTKYLLASQSSSYTPIKLGNWQYAENYATEIVRNLAFGSVGWIDFNLALDLQGGPSINSHYAADAVVMVQAKKSVYYRNPTFYAIGHLSRYVKPGSVRVKIDFYSSAHMFANQYIAFTTPDNYLVVFISNNNIGPMPVNIGINTRTKVETILETKSFNTFIFRLQS